MINKTEKKGFTIIEILITIVLIGLVLGIAIYLINPEKQFARGRNLERMSEIKVIYSAIERYNLVNKKYPDDVLEMGKGINSVKEICATGKIEQGQPLGEINCEGKLDLRVLVPTYVSEIPSDSRSKNETEVEGSGYVLYGTGYMAIKKNDGNLGLYAKVPENGAFLGIGITEEEMQEPPEPTEPSNIMDLTATVNNGEIILTWTEPFNGNSEIIEYQLNYIVGALGFEIILNPANLSYDIGAREYTYTVGSSVEDAGIKDFIKSIVDQGAEINYIATLISKNGIGESQESNQIEVKIGIPDTIENYQANITGSEASITWEKPNMNAGEFVAYKIRYSYDNFESYQEIVLGDVSSHNFNINQNGEIKFVIIAENEYGESTNPTNIITRTVCAVNCVDNGGANITIGTNTTFTEDQLNIGTLTINSGVSINTDKKIQANNITLGGSITSPVGTGLDLKVTDSLVLLATGSINVDGKGYQGGYNGNVQYSGIGPGAGAGGPGTYDGSGGGHGGIGGSGGQVGGTQYGSIENPEEMGSGGGRNPYGIGGNGGGLISLVIGGNANIVGNITANGQNGGGAGGSINIEIGGAMSGTGSIIANGGQGVGYAGGGAGGRIAIRYGSKSHSGNISANGGSVQYGGQVGGAGTIWQRDNITGEEYLVIDNNNVGNNNNGITTIDGSSLGGNTLKNLTITDRANVVIGKDLTIGNSVWNMTDQTRFVQNGIITANNVTSFSGGASSIWTQNAGFVAPLTSISMGASSTWVQNVAFNYSNIISMSIGNWTQNGSVNLPGIDNMTLLGGTVALGNGYSFKNGMNLTINSGGILTHVNTPTGNVKVNEINMTLGNLTINSGGQINVDSRGYQGGRNGNSQDNGYGTGGGIGNDGSGGGHGGAGGNSSNRVGGVQYGSIENPEEMGSGGGTYSSGAYPGRNGGGLIRLVIGGNANIVGSISANGQDAYAYAGGGAGGSINIEIGGAMSGTGSIIANGGLSGTSWSGGGGAGGRIAIRYGSKSHSGNISANGGVTGPGGQAGGAGSIWQRDNITGEEYLVIDNNNVGNNNNGVTTIDGSSLGGNTLKNLTITDRANVVIGKDLTIGNSVWNMTDQTRFVQNGIITANNVTSFSGGASSIWTQNAGFVAPLTSMVMGANSIWTQNVVLSNPELLTNFVMGANSIWTQNVGISYISLQNLNVGNWTQNGSVSLPLIDNMTLLGGTVALGNGYSFKNGMNLTINSGGILTHVNTPTGNVKVNEINMTLGNLVINSGGQINVGGRGYQGGRNGNSQSNGYGPGYGSGPSNGAGGGHGGVGGSTSNRTGGIQYGSIENPEEMGSGGGSGDSWIGGNGGGVVKLEIGGNANIVGSISANGQNGGIFGGGGAGGSINIEIGGAMNGTGSISANGGSGGDCCWQGGGGAGGRIAVRYGSKSHTGNISVNGGLGSQGGQAGGVGSIYQVQQ